MTSLAQRPAGRGARSTTRPAGTRAVLEICAVLALTSLHHAYGAIHYATPWRYHAVLFSAVALAVILGTFSIGQARPNTTAGRTARWVFWVVSVMGPVLLIGGFEGFYNHVVKDVLYFGGLPEAQMRRLFAPPTYEMPNDLFFEATGVLQVIPAGMAAYHLVGLAPTWLLGRDPPMPPALQGGRRSGGEDG
jgi:hypothetical protein